MIDGTTSPTQSISANNVKIDPELSEANSSLTVVVPTPRGKRLPAIERLANNSIRDLSPKSGDEVLVRHDSSPAKRRRLNSGDDVTISKTETPKDAPSFEQLAQQDAEQKAADSNATMPDHLRSLIDEYIDRRGSKGSLECCRIWQPSYHPKTGLPALWLHRSGTQLKAQQYQLQGNSWIMTVSGAPLEKEVIIKHILAERGMDPRVGSLWKVWNGVDGFEEEHSVLKTSYHFYIGRKWNNGRDLTALDGLRRQEQGVWIFLVLCSFISLMPLENGKAPKNPAKDAAASRRSSVSAKTSTPRPPLENAIAPSPSASSTVAPRISSTSAKLGAPQKRPIADTTTTPGSARSVPVSRRTSVTARSSTQQHPFRENEITPLNVAKPTSTTSRKSEPAKPSNAQYPLPEIRTPSLDLTKPTSTLTKNSTSTKPVFSRSPFSAKQPLYKRLASQTPSRHSPPTQNPLPRYSTSKARSHLPPTSTPSPILNPTNNPTVHFLTPNFHHDTHSHHTTSFFPHCSTLTKLFSQAAAAGLFKSKSANENILLCKTSSGACVVVVRGIGDEEGGCLGGWEELVEEVKKGGIGRGEVWVKGCSID
ncbi:MAG: hypothetical protein Q9227_008284 [Pyrenula ochraceoflavens]